MTAKMMSNMESVASLVGAYKGISRGLEEEPYVEGLISQAHGKTANAFDMAAAASAEVKRFTHAFEYGTAGVTRGPTKYPDPTSPAARLWVHDLMGQGGNQTVRYSFRPAVNRNPQPTTRHTGVPSKYLRKLSRRKYVFWNKAFVMETGQTVEIKSKQSHGLLFIPTPGANPPRGFVLFNTKAQGRNVFATPGASVQGNFTKFWMMWWGTAGNQMMNESMVKMVQEDIRKASIEAGKRAAAEKALKSPLVTDIIGTSSKSASILHKVTAKMRRKEKNTK